MHALIRRVAVLEAVYQAQDDQVARHLAMVHRYQGETIEDALLAEGQELEVRGRRLIVLHRPWRTRDTTPSEVT